MANKIDFLNEMIIEKEWQLSRRFMREIMDGIGTSIPIVILLVSSELYGKWKDYARMN